MVSIAIIGGGVVLGLLVGSFLNVVIYRLPIMMQREWQAEAREFLHGCERKTGKKQKPA